MPLNNMDMGDVKREIYNFFDFENRRSRPPAEHFQIVVDPGSFLIGGIGAAAVGCIADESSYDMSPSPNQEFFMNSLNRIIAFPIVTSVRFLCGGFVYMAVDTIMLHFCRRRIPFISGAVTGLCFASGGRSHFALGSILALAIFSQIADKLFDSVYK